MKIFEADHKQYIKLGDLYHLLRGLRQEIYDRYTRDENGTFIQEDGTPGLTKEDSIEIASYARVMPVILRNKVHACETPDEIRKIYERVMDEFYDGKYVLIMKQKDDDGKEQVYFFRKYCLGAMEARLKDEGKTDAEIEEATNDAVGDPVFSPRLKDCEFFEDHESADSSAVFINHNYGLGVEVMPAWYFNPNVKKRMMDFIDGKNDEPEREE